MFNIWRRRGRDQSAIPKHRQLCRIFQNRFNVTGIKVKIAGDFICHNYQHRQQSDIHPDCNNYIRQIDL
jgi:hypothetical protein